LTLTHITELNNSRIMIISMLNELFGYGRDDYVDKLEPIERMYIINKILFLSSSFGLLSDEETHFYNSLLFSDNLLTFFALNSKIPKIAPEPFVYQKPPILTTEQLLERLIVEKPKYIGIFMGSFDPPTAIHLGLIKFYRQFCDFLIVGVDSEKYIKIIKGNKRNAERQSYPLRERTAILYSLGLNIDAILTLPFNEPISSEGNEVINLLKLLHIKIVFLTAKDGLDILSKRTSQIQSAGCIPFVFDPYNGGINFGSTELIRRGL